MAIDKKLTQKAAKDRYIVLEMGISEAKRKEKIQTEKTMAIMIKTVEEMEEKIEEKEIELEDECMSIEDVGQAIYELTVDIECGEFSQEEKKEKECKKNELEKQKMERIAEFEKKKEHISQLLRKKIELQRHVGIIKEYLEKYRQDVKTKEGRALTELILSSDEEGKLKSRVSIEHYQTPSNSLEQEFLNYLC